MLWFLLVTVPARLLAGAWWLYRGLLLFLVIGTIVSTVVGLVQLLRP